MFETSYFTFILLSGAMTTITTLHIQHLEEAGTQECKSHAGEH